MPALLAAFLLAASAAPAQPTAQTQAQTQGQAQSKPQAPVAAGHHVVVNPDWVALPTSNELEDLYPRAARTANVNGFAKIQCKVGVDGALNACVTLTEDPPGWGFGDATVSAARFFQMRPETVDGVPTDKGKVIIPLNWKMGDAQASAPASPPPTIAEAQARDPEALAVARKIAARMEVFDLAVAQLTQAYRGWISPLFDRHDAARSAAFAEAFRTSLDDFTAERRDRVAAALVFQLSRAQLKDIAAFLETPSGAAFASGYPYALGRSYGQSQDLLAAFVDAWRTRYCGKVACDDSDLNSFSTLSNYYGGLKSPAPPPQQPDPPAK